MLRVANILNRNQSGGSVNNKNRIQIAGVVLDDSLHELTVDGEVVILTHGVSFVETIDAPQKSCANERKFISQCLELRYGYRNSNR